MHVRGSNRRLFLLPEIFHLHFHFLLKFRESVLVNKLRKRVQLPLIEQSYEIVAKPAHFAVAYMHEVLFVPCLGTARHLLVPVQPLKLLLSFCEGPFACVFLKNKANESCVVKVGVIFARPSEEQRNLVKLHQDTTEEKLLAVLRFVRLVWPFGQILGFTAPSMEVFRQNPIFRICFHDVEYRVPLKLLESSRLQIL